MSGIRVEERLLHGYTQKCWRDLWEARNWAMHVAVALITVARSPDATQADRYEALNFLAVAWFLRKRRQQRMSEILSACRAALTLAYAFLEEPPAATVQDRLAS